MAVETSLLSSCARAATAAEARFRIDRPIRPARAARIIALDERAAGIARRAAAVEWASAQFLVCEGVAGGGAIGDFLLRGIEGEPVVLEQTLAGADVVVMLATDDRGAGCAYALGKACWERGIMTAGLVLSDESGADQAVAALRPHARVLLPTADETDLTELLAALRA
ncbi:hypothetical protein [Modestobacter lapidis]|nr:3-methyl-2-oxobutanoate hydroxymethyltransferase [Modestobacter lapidis]